MNRHRFNRAALVAIVTLAALRVLTACALPSAPTSAPVYVGAVNFNSSEGERGVSADGATSSSARGEGRADLKPAVNTAPGGSASTTSPATDPAKAGTPPK